MGYRLRPATEQGEPVAGLSEQTAEVRSLLYVTDYEFFTAVFLFLDEKKVLPGFEPGSLDSKSRVITITL